MQYSVGDINVHEGIAIRWKERRIAMSRTIDADELEKQMAQYVNMLRVFRYLLVNSGYSVAEECLRMVQTAPTVDAVPVVRCKDCMYSYKVDSREPMYDCRHICRWGCNQWLGSDDFCSYGEMKKR